MTRFVRASAILGAIALCAAALAACGGGGGSGDGGGGTGAGSAQPPAATTAPATDAVETGAPAATAAATPATGGGGGAAGAGVCDLVTADELAGILGATAIKLAVLSGPPDTCDIQSGDGAPLAATVLMDGNGRMAFDAWAAGAGTRDMPGLGDRAVFVPESQLLLVLVGDSVYSIAVFDDDSRSEDERVELMRQIAAIAVGRM